MEQLFELLFGIFLATSVVLAPLCLVLWRRQRVLVSQVTHWQQLHAESRGIPDAIASQTSETIAEFRNRVETAERKASEYLGLIERVKGEEATWRKCYFSSAAAAGNAQHHFILERERNFQLMTTAGIKPFRDSALDYLIGAFKQEHYDPVMERLQQEKSPVDQPAKP